MTVGGGRALARPSAPDSRLVQSLRIALLGCLATGLVAAVLESVLLASSPDFILLMLAFPAIALLYIAAGVHAWWRRPGSMMGPLIVGGGVAMLLAGLTNTAIRPLEVIGELTHTVAVAVIIHLLLAFPSGYLRGPLSRLVVAIAYFSTTVPRVGFVLFDGLAAYLGRLVYLVGSAVMVLGTVLILAQRLGRATPAQRRTLLLLAAYGMGVVVFVPSGPAVLQMLFEMPRLQITAAQLLAIAGIPIVFLVAVLRGAFAPTAEAEALAVWLSAGPGRPQIRDALARALGDPTVELVYLPADGSDYVDAEGRTVSVPPPGSHPRDTAVVRVGGEPVGALVYDATTVGGNAALEAARVVALAIDGERLNAALRASEAQLRRSRARVVEAADRERSRIARDLHDGIQSRLVLLGVTAQRLARAVSGGLDADSLSERATQLRAGIDAAAAEVRVLAHGVMPMALEQRGLETAVEDLTDRMPIPTDVTMSAPAELAPEVARTAYFVVAEALTNLTKHSKAQRASVTIAQQGDALIVEVTDDGIGGALSRAGTGLSGLRDRVDAIGGRLTVESTNGAGTRIRGELPCAS